MNLIINLSILVVFKFINAKPSSIEFKKFFRNKKNKLFLKHYGSHYKKVIMAHQCAQEIQKKIVIYSTYILEHFRILMSVLINA